MPIFKAMFKSLQPRTTTIARPHGMNTLILGQIDF